VLADTLARCPELPPVVGVNVVYSLSLSIFAPCKSTEVTAEGKLGNDTLAVNVRPFWGLAGLKEVAAGTDDTLDNASPTSSLRTVTCPPSEAVPNDVELIVYVTVTTPVCKPETSATVVTVRIVPLVTLKFVLRAAPTTVIGSPTSGIGPEVIWNVIVPVVVTALSDRIKPLVLLARSLNDPKR